MPVIPESLPAAALRYAAAGLQLLPIWWLNDDGSCACGRDDCGSPGKHPLPMAAPNGLKDATCDTATVAAWWARWPMANIGMVMGSGSGVLALDVDSDTPGEARIAELAEANGGMPRTLTARTGGGGRHFLFRFDAELRARLEADGREIANRAGIGVKGIDVRAERIEKDTVKRGYILVAPSSHESGERYTWIDEVPPAALPDWLYDLISRPIRAHALPAPERPPLLVEDRRARGWLNKTLDGMCAKIMGTPQGGRHIAISRAAYTLGGRIGGGAPFTPEEVASALIPAGLAAYGGKDVQVTKTVWDGLRDGQRDRLKWPPETWDDDAPAYVPSPPAGRFEDEPPVPEFEHRERLSYLNPPRPRLEEDQDEDDEEPQRANVHRLPPPVHGSSALKPEPVEERKPTINVSRPPDVVVDHAWHAVLTANERDPAMFQTNGNITRVVRSEQGARIAVCSTSHVLERLIRVARWTRCRMAKAREASAPGGVVEVPLEGLPRDTAEMMNAKPHAGLPILEHVTYAPTFAADGELLAVPGYHAAEHLWFEELRPVHRERMSVAQAREFLFDWLADFPFATPGDRTRAIALFLLPFVRRMVNGPTPIHLFDAPAHGTGKSLCASIVVTAATGRAPAMSPFDRREEEVKKVVTTILLEGRPVAVFDNVDGTIDSPSFALATSGTRYADRVLGQSGGIDVVVQTIWVLTSNNAKASTEITRRMLPIRLARLHGEAFDVRTARHPDIEAWTLENHSRLVSAALTLVEAWQADGKPAGGSRQFASYESWLRVVGGILDHAGIPGLMDGVESVKAELDPVASEWAAFVGAWARRKGSLPCTAKELLDMAQDLQMLASAHAHANDTARAMVFGKQVAKRKDQVFKPDPSDTGNPLHELGAARVARGPMRNGSQTFQLVHARTGAVFPRGTHA